MKLIFKDIKQGIVKIKVENLDDLWYLSQIVVPGDIVKGQTIRKIKLGSIETKGEVFKKTVFLSILVEKVEFSKYESSLRISGVVNEEKEDIPKGSHHTFGIEENTIIEIEKSWLKYQLEKLDEAIKSKAPSIIICIFDREEAIIALSKRYGYDVLIVLKGDVAKKDDRAGVGKNFYTEIIKVLQEYNQRYSPGHIILASPAFWKEELFKELKDENLKKKIVQATCSSVDESAVNEVLKRQEIRQVLLQDRIAKEVNLVDYLLKEISTNGKAAYGFNETKQAIENGAAEKLLVTDALIQKKRMENNFKELDDLMKLADKMNSEIHILSSENEAGQKLDGLGGVAAILRYKTNY